MNLLRRERRPCHYCSVYVSQVNTLGAEAERLSGTHPEQADEIAAKQSDILNNWQKLSQKVRSVLLFLQEIRTW